MKKNSRIFITGHQGMVGRALLRRFKKEGSSNLLTCTPAQLDLTNQKAVRSFFKKERPQYCFLTPVKEGGIAANIAYPAELIYQNLTIQANIIHSAREAKVKKLIFFASSCVYPKNCPQPMKEKYLFTGPLESTSEAYALAKLSGIKLCQAYNSQYGTNFIAVIPATVYGPDDNFDQKSAHVISALIAKFHGAKVKKKSKVAVWGTGRARREFIYVEDLVDACVFLLHRYNSSQAINIGSGYDISIRRLAQLMKKITGFKGKIKFDPAKPEGVMKKLLNVRRLNSLGWKAKVDLAKGIEDTYRWYKQNMSRS